MSSHRIDTEERTMTTTTRTMLASPTGLIAGDRILRQGRPDGTATVVTATRNPQLLSSIRITMSDGTTRLAYEFEVLTIQRDEVTA